MISTIIPTYKEPDALDLCLKSAINDYRQKQGLEQLVFEDTHI